MIKQIFILIFLFILFSCSEKGNQDNPFDQSGDNWYPPIIVQQADTVVSQLETVTISPKASDENGLVIKYHWDMNADGVWDTTGNVQNFRKPEGGLRTIIWGAEDNDGLIVPDTFSIRFNRAPNAISLSDMVHAGKISWSATDPDGDIDTLIYLLKIGTDSTKLDSVYTGNSAQTIQWLNSETTYFYSITATDLFGASFTKSGRFISRIPGMAFIPAKDSSFQMGSTNKGEQPVHKVSFTYDFWMDTTEVTQKQFTAVRNIINDYAKKYYVPGKDNYPANEVNWFDAIFYCNALSKLAGRDTVYAYTHIVSIPGVQPYLGGFSYDLKKNGFRLPTEAEWEYACRAGTTGDSYGILEEISWPCVWTGIPHEVAGKKPNNFGLYDMIGHYGEWVFENYLYDIESDAVDPVGNTNGEHQAIRGAGYPSSSTCRTSDFTTMRNSWVSFRTVCTATIEK